MSTTKKRVAVIGLGTAGSMSAWRLAARGAEVVGYEQFGIAHDRSAHAGESRIFRTAYFEDPEYVPLLRTAKSLWRELEGETGTELLALRGNLMLGDSSSQMGNVSDSIDKFGVDASVIPIEEARHRWPHHPFHEGDVVVLDREAGYLRPELAVLQAAARAQSLGAQLRTYTPVEGIEAKDDGVWVTAAGHSERYDHVVVTTGPWAAKLLPELAGLVDVRKAVSAWFVAKERGAFDPANFPCFIRTAPEEYYGLPAMDGNGLKLGLSGTVNRPVPDPDALDRTVPIDEVQAFRELVAQSFPALYPDPVRVAAYMEGYTPDGHGIVGPLGGGERLTVVTGLSGHGFKLAPALGEIAADYVLNGSSHNTIPLLSPERFLAVPTSSTNQHH
ncbi:N-methyl-L-tryptophan oxidase [Arthrobacter sp. CDRTa11]|uniref:N-methyl-L-tryptophan oxidase n=1 Tax=Arthrobacter sp. CDRTa11 TaxID=2651199 RepID=UPI002265AFDE|nr:N-methyl-L-tryptophan oxidase [Arthrobacter sp. CDRTa11]UZX04665.1 N-methyl-L-tryptophan oxidase [Arthrobacter sp. CDRTa11]